MRSAVFRAAAALAIALGAFAAAYVSIEQSRYLVLTTYLILFALFFYFVVVFRGGARDASLAGASLALCLVVLELVIWRVAGAPMTFKEKGSWAPKAELGWSLARPGVIHEKKVAANGDVIYDVANTIDANLLRKVDSAAAGPTIAFFGDSMTFGAGLNDEETLPQSFADITDRKYRVLNFAVTAYGPQQYLRALEVDAFDGLLKQDPRLFIMLTAPWHAARTSCVTSNSWHAPSYELQEGKVVYRGPCSARAPGVAGVFRSVFRSTEAFKYFFESRERPLEEADIDRYIAILTKAGEVARQKYGVPTLILFLPDDLASARYRLGPGYGNEDIMRKLSEGGLLVLNAMIDASAYPPNSLIIPGDGHPTGLANRIWAKQIKDYIDADMPNLKRE